MNNYHLYEEIGGGAFSTVYKGRHRFSIHYVAIKMGEKRSRESITREVSALESLSEKNAKSHRNVVAFYGYHETRNHLWEIMEYCAGGDLMRLLREDEKLPEEQVRLFGRDIAEGLFYIHANGYLHCDLKLSNILFNETGEIKLADFGLARRLDSIVVDEGRNVTLRGSPYYMAAELFYSPAVHSRQSDIWSLAVVLYELAVGNPPFPQTSFTDLAHSIVNDPPPRSNLSSAFLDVIMPMLNKKREERFDWTQVQGHIWWGDQALPSMGKPLPPQEHLVALKDMSVVLSDAVRMASVAQRHMLEATQGKGDRAPCWEENFKLKNFDQELNFSVDYPAANENSDRVSVGVEDKRDSTYENVAEECLTQKPVIEVKNPGAVCLPAALNPDSIPDHVMKVLCRIDRVVKPISNNRDIEKVEECAVPANLPFKPINIEDVFRISNQELEEFLTRVYKCIAQGDLDTKHATLVFLEQLCGQMQVADLVANSSLLRLVVKMIRVRNPELRTRLWSLIGQLLRHSTFLEPNIQSLGIFEELLQALEIPTDKAEILPRRKAAAAMGELLFYVATQPPTQDQQRWRVSQTTLTGVVRLLCNADEDTVVLHYLVKAIENVATQSPKIALKWFLVSSYDLSKTFYNYALRNDKSDSFRLTCFGALAMFSNIMQNNVIAVLTTEQGLDLRLIRMGLLGDLAPRGISPSLQLLLVVSQHAKDAMLDEELVLAILHMSQPRTKMTDTQRGINDAVQVSILLRCKAIFFLALLAQLHPHWLSLLFSNGFCTSLEKLSREDDETAQETVAGVMELVTAMLAPYVENVIGELKAFSDQDVQQLRDKLHAPVHLLSCALLRPCLLAPSVLSLLGELLSSDHVAFRCQLLLLAEAFSGQTQLLFDAIPADLDRFVEGVVDAMLVCDDNESLFIGLKAFTDLYVGLVNEGVSGLNSVFIRAVPAFPRLLTANDPLPSWTLKLIAAYLSDAPGDEKVLESIREPLLTALTAPVTMYSARVAAGMLQRNISFDVVPIIAQLRQILQNHALEDDDVTESQTTIVMDPHVLDGALTLLEAALDAKVDFVACIGPLFGVLPPLAPIAFHLCQRALRLCERATFVFEPIPITPGESRSLLIVLDSTSQANISASCSVGRSTESLPPTVTRTREQAIVVIRWAIRAERNEVLLSGLASLLRKNSALWEQETTVLAQQCIEQC